jgi:hypothetical protein
MMKEKPRIMVQTYHLGANKLWRLSNIHNPNPFNSDIKDDTDDKSRNEHTDDSVT